MAIDKSRQSSPPALDVLLQAQKNKYAALIESIGEGLIVINQDGNIEHVNAYAAKALGVAPAELMGKWFPGAIQIVDEYGHPSDLISRPITRAFTEGVAISEYSNFLRPDGTRFPVHITASPIIIDGRPAGGIEVFRDLTHEQELDMAKDEFVSIASHQLRTPATGIRGILSMLLSGDFGELNSKQRKYLEMANHSNDRQLHIIENLLSVARADSGRLTLLLVNLSLSKLVTEVVAEHELIIARNHQNFKVDIAPNIMIWGDVEKIKMVVDNLLSNAAKYTPRGGTISVKLAANLRDASLLVRDNGVGVPPDKQQAIFSKFTRVDNELSVPAGGTGLGLYLALKIIKLHQGDIKVASAVGQGSEFRVLLPIQQPKEQI